MSSSSRGVRNLPTDMAPHLLPSLEADTSVQRMGTRHVDLRRIFPRPPWDLALFRAVAAPIFLLFLFLSVISVAMPTVFFLCASLRRSKPKAQKEEQERPATATSSLADGKLVSGIRVLVAAALSWKRGEPGEVPLWKKTILMGVKCRQLEFSGRILYDSEGNQLVQELPKKSPRN
ncbi:hypothetical protein Taro_053425 [Colocasia esculenta]|uniref:Transmembrane protein n=1 Tax=Colocasia esculenta TaxID=4460 RepID=A0A843XN50_COLES|nr:hypothetical protein [Colocasia esculenta]